MHPERNRNPRSSDQTETRYSPKITARNNKKYRNNMATTANGDASSDEVEVAVVPSSSLESVNDEVADSSSAEDDGVELRSSSDEEEEEEIEDKPKSVGKRGKKRSRKEEDLSETEDKREDALYTFPMKRISQIMKSGTPDLRISQEAVFVINKASV